MPPIISIVRLWIAKNFPIVPMTAPKSRKTTVNPSENKIPWRRIFLLEGVVVDVLEFATPVMYAK